MSLYNNKLSELNHSKLKETIELLDLIVDNGQRALKRFPDAKYELFTFTFINYLERFTFSLESINILLNAYVNKPNVETSIGLIIRTGLLDFMTVSYLTAFYSEISPADGSKKEKFDEEFNALLADQINNTFSYLKVLKDTGVIDEKERIETIDSLKYTYSFLFNETVIDYSKPDKALISQKVISPKAIFRKINSHPVTKKFSMVYDLYTYYSKYEHYGIITHFLQRNGMDYDFDSFMVGIKYLVKGQGIVLTYLTSVPDIMLEHKNKFIELENKLAEI